MRSVLPPDGFRPLLSRLPVANPIVSSAAVAAWALRRRRRFPTTHAAAGPVESVELVLNKLRGSMGVSAQPGQEVIVNGRGQHLGISIAWRLRWRADGAFYEEIRGRELGFKWGFDGGLDSSSCWEMDSSGVSRSIECDDHEALLLSTWVRTGLWLQPHLQDRFDIQLELPQQQPQMEALQAQHAPTGQPRQPVKAKGSKTARRMAAASGGIGGSTWRRVGGSQSSPASSLPALAQQAWSSLSGREADSSNQADGGLHGGDAAVDEDRQASSSHASSSGRLSEGSARGAATALLGSLQGVGPQQKSAPVTLKLVLKGGKLLNRVRVCPLTWTVLGLEQPMCGDTEVWVMTGWSEWNSSRFRYPKLLRHFAVGGGQHAYETENCQVAPWSPIQNFQLPVTPLLPIDTTFDETASPEVPVWRAQSGHYLVRPKINGVQGNFYWLVDTGASGFVISPKAALNMGLEAFGQLFAASISGKVPARFIKAASWSLGPVTIRNPVMMTMNLEGLVKGGPGEVLGIVGYDIFRRAVVELPRMADCDIGAPLMSARRAPGVLAASVLRSSVDGVPASPVPPPRPSTSSSKASSCPPWRAKGPFPMMLFNPDKYSDQKSCSSWVWHPVKMIASLPHLEVRFLDASGTPRSVLLMLDTGACGADIMLHSRAIQELGLDLGFGEAGRSSSHQIRGVGGSSGDSVQVSSVELPWLDVAGVRFRQVKVMCAGVSGLDISLYSGGIICGDLVARVAMAVDYSRKRVGFLRQDLASLSGAEGASQQQRA